MTEFYPWIVLLHIVGAFLFALSHGVAVWMVVRLRAETDPRRITALLDLSSTSLNGLYLGLLLLLVGGIWAGIVGSWFGRGWIWAAIGVLVAIVIAMYLIATPYFARLRTAIGQRPRDLAKDAPDPVALPDSDIAALAAGAPMAQLTGIGFGGLVIILWLMVVKPF
jgi:hypothetical protein